MSFMYRKKNDPALALQILREHYEWNHSLGSMWMQQVIEDHSQKWLQHNPNFPSLLKHACFICVDAENIIQNPWSYIPDYV